MDLQMLNDDIQRIETDLLLEAMFRRYGYDFRSYARASIERRVRQFLSGSGCGTISEMIPKLIHDREFFTRLALHVQLAGERWLPALVAQHAGHDERHADADDRTRLTGLRDHRLCQAPRVG